MARTPTFQQAQAIKALSNALAQAGLKSIMKIEAVAGSGKTSTLTMMAEVAAVPSLYLAFNKVTAEEASVKFPRHVTCKTTHSLAFATFGKRIGHKVNRPKGRYVNVAGTGSEIGRYFGVQDLFVDEDTVITAAHFGLLAKTAVARFEQSADATLGHKHLPKADIAAKLNGAPQAEAEVQNMVLMLAQDLWAERIDPASPVLCTHDTYLKLYQLSKPVLRGYEVIYVDEFQDTTPCVMDIVLNQSNTAHIVVVGDARQAIYSWRGAVNAMKLIEAPTYLLSQSFRYGQAVADAATAVLERDVEITGNPGIDSVIGGADVVNTEKPYTRLFRTNAALLTAAIGELKNGTDISIEINVKDFVNLLTAALALYNHELKNVKHEKLLAFANWEEMMGEAENDPELGRIAKIVMGGEARSWIETLENHKNSARPHVTFTTAHKSKGREWSQVRVENDFKSCYNEDNQWVGLSEEEQNLLYVAVTRAIDCLEYNLTVAEYLERDSALALKAA